MTSSLSGVNLVLVGENFPTGSLTARDFTFRGRSFAETLRVGPLFQASSRNVEIQAFPERFQVAIDAPDDLDILSQGVAEVVETFLEFVGKRTVTAVGHNAQVKIPASLYEQTVSALVRQDVAAELLEVAEAPSANITFKTKVGSEDVLGLSFVAEATPGADGGIIDFNFNYDVRGSDAPDALATALGLFRDSMTHAERILASVQERFGKAPVR